jgi:glycosyltransferase involved in cell wall biosynthesis
VQDFIISIITITFNNYSELLETIESVSPVLDDQIEHIVINGGSCEQTQKYLANDFKGLAISEPDQGIADAFNKGVKAARGQYICFINSGDKLIDLSYFNAIKKHLNDDIDFVCCDNIHQVFGVGQVYKKCKLCFPDLPFNHQGLIMKKSLISDFGGFDLSYKISMDYDLIAKVYSKITPRIFYYKNPVILMDGNGVSHTRNDIGVREKFRALKKHGLLTDKLLFLLTVQLIKAYIKRGLSLLKLDKLIFIYKNMRNKFGK